MMEKAANHAKATLFKGLFYVSLNVCRPGGTERRQSDA